MEKNYFDFKNLKKPVLPRWAQWVVKGLLVVVLLVILAYVGLAWYLNSHKDEVLAKLNTELNKSLNGSLQIGNMETTFLKGFPRVSLQLENTLLRDSLYDRHKHTLLKAGSLDVAVNALALLRGTVEIQKIAINDAKIDFYTDASGYSNTSIFKKSAPKDTKEGGGSFPQLKVITLDNVEFIAANVKMNKLYDFKVHSLRGDIKYTSAGVEAGIKLKTLAKSMSFNTGRGSFIKNKELDGRFDIALNKETGIAIVKKNPLDIGGEHFVIGARFNLKNEAGDFTFNISNKSILWRNAAGLLSANITDKLNMFDIKKPIAVKCDLVGGFNVEGDPLIRVNATVADNTLVTNGGAIDKCNFFGVFTNNQVKEQGYTDANSAIKLYNFNGEYKGIPFVMKKIFILNLENPLAVGNFSSQFDMTRLAGVVDENLIKFSKGTANVKVDFTADIVNFALAKPLVSGLVHIKDADVTYVPRKLSFKDITVNLDFTRDNLEISEIILKSGKSIVNMKGNIKNLMNLYYTDPEKIVVNWEIYSPQLHMGEFLAFLGSRNTGKAKEPVKKSKPGNVTEELNTLFEKSSVDMKVRVDNLHYNRFLATDVTANVLLNREGIVVNNVALKHAGGTATLNGSLAQKGKVNQYRLNANINNVDVSRFFYAMKNFGMESLTSQNIKGIFSSKMDISGNITNTGDIVPKSIYGRVTFGLKKGRLVNFEPVYSIGQFAFPFRDMKNIYFDNLKGQLDIKGEKVTIHPLKISSSVLNMDVQGVYSFGPGTNIYIDVPLRNPKKDKDITDKEELEKRRNRGIVLHLNAADDEKDGKTKIKLGGKKD
jgi:hypothetical protein